MLMFMLIITGAAIYGWLLGMLLSHLYLKVF